MKNYYVLLGLFFSLLTSVSAQTTEILTGLTNPRGLAVNGDDLYIAEIGTDKILKIDLSQTNPTPVEVVIGLDAPRELVINGNFLYISEGSRISKVDITSSLPATRQDFFNGVEQPQGMLIHENYLYTKGANNNIFKFNLDSPAATFVFGTGYTYDFVKVNNEAYMGQDGQIQKFDITVSNPSITSVLTGTQSPLINGTTIGMTAVENIIYTITNTPGDIRKLLSFDVTDPVGTLTDVATLNGVGDVTVHNNNLYISDVNNGKILKYELPDNSNSCTITHDPSNPTPISINSDGFLLGQSFEAECSGQLESVALISGGSGTITTGTLNIYNGETVTDTPIYTQQYTEFQISQSGDPIKIDLTGDLSITQGQQYTFEFKVTNVTTLFDFSGGYTNGISFQDGVVAGTRDLAFNVVIAESNSSVNDMAHYYSLDSQVVVDEIGNEDPTLVQSTAVSTGVVNGSHAFNNADNITFFDFAPNSFTINLWFRTNDINKVQRIFHRGGYGGSTYDRYSYSLVYIPNQGFRLGLGNDTGSNAALIYANASINLNDWHMITCSYDQNSQAAKIYIDGNLVSSDTSTQAIYAVPNYQPYLEFSRYPLPGQPQAIDGNVDEIGLWTRALSDTEVTTVYNENATLGTNDFNLTEASVKLFPNPAKNTIKVNNLKASEQYEIYNLLGQSVKEGTIENNQRIDISNLVNGVYLLKLKNTTKTLRFIKE